MGYSRKIDLRCAEPQKKKQYGILMRKRRNVCGVINRFMQ